MLIVNDGSSLGPVGADAVPLESDTGDVDVWAIPVAIGNTATSGFKQPLVPRIKDHPKGAVLKRQVDNAEVLVATNHVRSLSYPQFVL